MFLSEQYTMYRLAYHLFMNEGYHLLHINDSDGEIWLEKHKNKRSQVIRISHETFGWKNHLKKDIAQVFQKTKAMQHLLLGKSTKVYNVYVSSYPPVDDWEELKSPSN